ncbi:MAG: hypothetical protein WKF58_04385 [Ilumatobacteraceae bacterium]
MSTIQFQFLATSRVTGPAFGASLGSSRYIALDAGRDVSSPSRY